jgi:hypothetical protein
LILRVRKLMDKAAATSNPHEADAFAAKAAELVARHRIDPDRLAGRAGDDQLAIREIMLGRGAYVRARLSLLTAVARNHDARVVFGSSPTGTIAYVAGYSSDLEVVELMYHSLHGQAAAQMAAQRRSTGAATQRFRRSFLFGYAERMSLLLAESRRDVEASAGGDETVGVVASNALALQERSSRVDAFLERSLGRTRTARAAGMATTTGWEAGYQAAGRADVGRARLAGRRAIGKG